jgi:hypothetical protein
MQAIRNADGRLEVFARDSDRALIHRHRPRRAPVM